MCILYIYILHIYIGLCFKETRPSVQKNMHGRLCFKRCPSLCFKREQCKELTYLSFERREIKLQFEKCTRKSKYTLNSSTRSSSNTSHCNILQHNATHCNTLQNTAKHCNTLQCSVTRYNTNTPPPPRRDHYQSPHTTTHCNTLHHNETRCNTLQHTAKQKYPQLRDVTIIKNARDRARK